MCGIFGVINFNNNPIDENRVIKARDIMQYRGPDDSGFYLFKNNNGAFAHRRLSIIDLSPSAHQPMLIQNSPADAVRINNFAIVFNGEIYNYKNLINLLDDENKTNLVKQSDTSVLLNLFVQKGKFCLQDLRGMFSFAIWDEKEQKLFAARDRFGIKPFYYYKSENEFIFSSELKAIKHYKNDLSISIHSIDSYLRTGSVPAPFTIYNDVYSLLPGHFLEIDKNGNLYIEQYWSFLDLFTSFNQQVYQNGKEANKNLKKAINKSPYNDESKIKIRNALLDTITAHQVADVEVGAFLSGGIDSTAIVSLMRQIGHTKLKTISVTFPGFVFDEAEFSNVAAQVYETDHFEYRLQEHEVIDHFDSFINMMDQPTIDGVNTYFVSKAAKAAGLKVVLSGLGGDELFGGYPSFKRIPKYNRIKNLPFAKLAMKMLAPFVKDKLPAKAVRYMKQPDRLNAEYIMIRGLFTDDELHELGWKHNYKHPYEISTLEKNARHNYNDNFPVFNLNDFPLQYVSELETNHYMRNQLLRDSDNFSMAHSLELRVPFVDHLLYSEVLPYLTKGFNKDFTKKMLVDAVGDIPPVISDRLKMGFTFPFDIWMRSGKMNSLIRETLTDKNNNDILPVESRLKLLRKFDDKKIHWSRVWALTVLIRFLARL